MQLSKNKGLRIGDCGGGARVRTEDLLRAKQALSQLSYTPNRPNDWWAHLDSNQGPQPYQGCALTN